MAKKDKFVVNCPVCLTHKHGFDRCTFTGYRCRKCGATTTRGPYHGLVHEYESGWRPIYTAPWIVKVLIWNGERMSLCHYNEKYKQWLGWGIASPDSRYLAGKPPLYWMPLPCIRQDMINENT